MSSRGSFLRYEIEKRAVYMMTKVAGHGVNEQNVVIKELRNHLVSHQTPDVAIVSNDNLKSGTITFGRKMKGNRCECLSMSL